jgi:hypothetical protein
MEDEEEENRDAPKQEIFVLRGGFAGFQQKYRVS